MIEKLKLWLKQHLKEEIDLNAIISITGLLIAGVSMLISLGAVATAVLSIRYSISSDERDKALFGTQIVPIVQEIPVGADFVRKSNMVTIYFELTNITNFLAKNIGIDAKLGDNVWISQWTEAKKDDIKRKKILTAQDEWLIDEWKLQESQYAKWVSSVLDSAESEIRPVTGAIDVDKICGPPGITSEVESTIKTRTTWRNERQRYFDRISSYTMVCTRVDSGISLTFILKNEDDPRKIP